TYAETRGLTAALGRAWRNWQTAQLQEQKAADLAEASREEEDLLRHHLAELVALTPENDEEDRLSARRGLLQNAARLGDALNQASGELTGTSGAQAALSRAARRLERAGDRAQGLFDVALAAAERAAAETSETIAALERAARNLELDPRELETVEERL